MTTDHGASPDAAPRPPVTDCSCEDPTCRGCTPTPSPFAGPPPAWDGGHCSRHGMHPQPGCVGCPQHWTYRPLLDGFVRHDTPSAVAPTGPTSKPPGGSLAGAS